MRFWGASFVWFDRLLTDEIARLMDCDCGAVEKHEEKRDPLYYRLFKAFLRGSHEGVQNVQRMKMVDTDCIREVAERVVRRAADEGNCVIVGRDSAYYLPSRQDAFHVFVYAPIEDKVRRLQAAGKSDLKAAGRRDQGVSGREYVSTNCLRCWSVKLAGRMESDVESGLVTAPT